MPESARAEDGLRRPFNEHLGECGDCVRYLREYRATVDAGQLAYADELPADMPEDLVKTILDARHRR